MACLLSPFAIEAFALSKTLNNCFAVFFGMLRVPRYSVSESVNASGEGFSAGVSTTGAGVIGTGVSTTGVTGVTGVTSTGVSVGAGVSSVVVVVSFVVPMKCIEHPILG